MSELIVQPISKTVTYRIWAGMKSRCADPKSKYYGARGIKVCDRWARFKNFLADMGERPAGKTIDRIDGSGNYEPDNCRWATYKQQRLNQQRTVVVEFQGRRINMGEVSEISGIDIRRIWQRVHRGWTIEEATNPQFNHRRLSKRSGPVQSLQMELVNARARRSHWKRKGILGTEYESAQREIRLICDRLDSLGPRQTRSTYAGQGKRT